MPGFVTHYLFGVNVFQGLPNGSIKKNLRKNHAAFALGLQGPDVFFYYLPSYLLHQKNLGALAHDHATDRFFSALLESRNLFAGDPVYLGIADAYLTGFMGHYTLDCLVHPYVYAFTNMDPANKPKDVEYFGQHAYFETELDNVLLYRFKHIYPSQFHQNATIHLNQLQKHVISEMLTYAYHNTFPEYHVTKTQVRHATQWMKIGTRLLRDPSGQKKVLVRFLEKIAINRPFISAMLPSDSFHFVPDPLNLSRRFWQHPWTGKSSREGFFDLYKKALRLYRTRIHLYYDSIRDGYTPESLKKLQDHYGGRSFLSGLPLNLP
ncbi:zinc dependent phospholipase C family protein [Agathobacter ruminis]|uniref:Phospholipase C/D domain-containing protein n=1 Tax=Agathobacter ruminis TaxID=1712665 RepID=A0A2G3E4M1_9FIRM|nr:zinc dependent phospholipase C family protein [Agathobacter ruminis]MDC7301244.1 zinc dependent phospholipase C family protein [Agathobacter ruminis]PHU38110.1 hypothetical protein CSX02_04335 [Agathobacter ruminis]